MLIKIGEFDCTECWDGVFYKKLAKYPDITEWEIQTVLDFESYEKQNGRNCLIEADENILKAIKDYKKTYESGKRVHVPDKITECVACPKYRGCMTDYVMFAWGNCQAGDRLVMERKMNRFPTEEDLSVNFTPGVRFFFKYDEIVNHPNATFEGVLPLKNKEEIILSDWVDMIIIPSEERKKFESIIPPELEERTFYLDNDCKDIWSWSEKVYEFVKKYSKACD